MTHLNETELLERLSRRKETQEVTYEEVSNPDYEVWGRARQWTYPQAVCLLSGLQPISHSYLDPLTKNQVGIAFINCLIYYPANQKDITRLRNIDLLLAAIPGLAEIKKNKGTIQPKDLISLCSQQSELSPFLPKKLIEIIETTGAHPSLNLPNVFSVLEINPLELENSKKFADRQNNPLALSSVIREESQPSLPPLPPIPEESPLSIAKKLFPLKKFDLWNRADLLSATEIILLHYGIDPAICNVHPGEKTDDPFAIKLIEYLSQYFYSDIQWFLNQLDENHLKELLERSVQAGSIKAIRGNQFVTIKIIEWMHSKKLSFPLTEKNTETPFTKTIEIDTDLQSRSLDDKLRLALRLTASAICGKSTNLMLKEIVHHSSMTSTRKLWKENFGCECTDKTCEDWIRDVNPNYKPRKK